MGIPDHRALRRRGHRRSGGCARSARRRAWPHDRPRTHVHARNGHRRATHPRR
jgi:hypothetical protein